MANTDRNDKDKDKEIRECLGQLWDRLNLTGCCGGRGLVVGCPRCGKRWGK